MPKNSIYHSLYYYRVFMCSILLILHHVKCITMYLLQDTCKTLSKAIMVLLHINVLKR